MLGFSGSSINWVQIIRQMSKGRFTPIISSSLDLAGVPAYNNGMAKAWAESSSYDLKQQLKLVEVAQILSMSLKDDGVKEDYLDFSKEYLNRHASAPIDGPDLYKKSFTQLAKELKFLDQEMTPLDIIARMPLPIFLTTSHYTFLEQALIKAGKKPRSEIASWHTDLKDTSDQGILRQQLVKHFTIVNLKTICLELDVDHELLVGDNCTLSELAMEMVRYFSKQGCLEKLVEVMKEKREILNQEQSTMSFESDSQNPIVYHLFGLETNPKSIVLTEDDYLKYLVNISQDQQSRTVLHSRIHLKIYEVLTDSQLMLLGYNLRDWDFKVLYKGLITTRDRSRSSFNLAIQLSPEDELDNALLNETQARRYLESYFEHDAFYIFWGTVNEFTKELWQHGQGLYRDA